MDKSILIIISNYDFNEIEYSVPKNIFEENNIHVQVASLDGGKCFGFKGLVVEADLSIMEVDAFDFDAVVFVGGSGVELYFDNIKTLDLVREFYGVGKLTCAICGAPVVLAKAGILLGKRATVWSGGVKDLNEAGAIFTDEAVTVDGNIITASGPAAAAEFAKKVVEMV